MLVLFLYFKIDIPPSLFFFSILKMVWSERQPKGFSAKHLNKDLCPQTSKLSLLRNATKCLEVSFSELTFPLTNHGKKRRRRRSWILILPRNNLGANLIKRNSLLRMTCDQTTFYLEMTMQDNFIWDV